MKRSIFKNILAIFGVLGLSAVLLGAAETPSELSVGSTSASNTLNAVIAALGDGINNFVKKPASVTATSNNPYGLGFDDLKARFGIERVMFCGLMAIPHADGTPYDSDGLVGQYPVSCKTGKADKRIRFYGSDWEWNVGTTGRRLLNNVSGEYFEVTGVFTGLSTLITASPSYATPNIFVDDSDIGIDHTFQGNGVLNSESYPTNTAVTVDLVNGAGTQLTQGIHTIKLQLDANEVMALYGIEFVNEGSAGSEINVTAGTEYIQGEKVDFAATNLNYKGSTANGGDLYSGKRGARIAVFRQRSGENAVYVSKKQDVETNEQTGTTDTTTGDDRISGLASETDFYSGSQGNLVRIYETANPDNKMLLVPTSISSNDLVFDKAYDGSDSGANEFSDSTQYKENGTTNSSFGNGLAVTVELYGKVTVNADHSDEELVREIHWREPGSGRSDDLSTLVASSGSPEDKAFTLDDGTTSLVVHNGHASAGALHTTTSGDYYMFTFIGSGIDVRVQTSTGGGPVFLDGVLIASGNWWSASSKTGIARVVSDLPYGTHTIKFARSAGAEFMRLVSFLVYQPKTPELEGYQPEFKYNVLANQVLTSLPTLNGGISYIGNIDQGVVRKIISTREAVYVGTWNYGGIAYNDPGGRNMWSGSTTSYVDLTIFAEGDVRAIIGNDNDPADVIYRLDGVDGSPISVAANTQWHQMMGHNMTLGVHTVGMKVSTGSSQDSIPRAIDYHTPIYEPAQWRTNPYQDLLIGSGSLGDGRKLSAVDEKLPARVYSVDVNFISGLSTAESVNILLPGLGMIIPVGRWEVYVNATSGTDSTNSSTNGDLGQSIMLMKLDGSDLTNNAEPYGMWNFGTKEFRAGHSFKYTVNNSKKTALIIYHNSVIFNGGMTTHFIDDAHVSIRKISD